MVASVSAMGVVVKTLIGLYAFTAVMFAYGSILHATRTRFVVAYHKFWPTDDIATLMIENNPHHHPNHCWNYFSHPDSDSYFPNLHNTSYPLRSRLDGYDMSPYSTSTSFVYVCLAVCVTVLAGYAENKNLADSTLVADGVYIPTRVDVGGIVLSLAWVAASSAEFHRVPGAITRHSDWAMIAPLLAWIGADAAGIEQWTGPTIGFVFKFACVFSTIYTSFAAAKIAILVGIVVLCVGYVLMYIRRACPSRNRAAGGDLTRYDFLDVVAVLLSGYAATACKSFGNDPYSFGFLSGMFPNHEFHHLAECTNDITAARLEDITHGWWHVESAVALWFLILTVFGVRPLENNPVLYAVHYTLTLALIVTVWTAHPLHNSTYYAWIGVTYGILFAWICVLAVVIWTSRPPSTRTRKRVHYKYNPLYTPY
jgi:hypothetical protein